jgi:hypothetical protein
MISVLILPAVKNQSYSTANGQLADLPWMPDTCLEPMTRFMIAASWNSFLAWDTLFEKRMGL